MCVGHLAHGHMQRKNERGETLITKEVINSILGISESYELPEKMMSFLFDDSKREKMFDMFMEHSNDLTHDWFTSYFEEEHAVRSIQQERYTYRYQQLMERLRCLKKKGRWKENTL